MLPTPPANASQINALQESRLQLPRFDGSHGIDVVYKELLHTVKYGRSCKL